MAKQNFERKSDEIRAAFEKLKETRPTALEREIDLSWSNWGFGLEPLQTSAARLAEHGFKFIELHGNRYGSDIGYQTKDTQRVLADHGLKVSGICGMFSPDCDLSSNRPHVRQRAIDYIKRQTEMARELGGAYLLVVPGAVGRPTPIDAYEFDRSVAALQVVADHFVGCKIHAAIEPIRAAEVSFCHTIADAQAYISAVAHEGVRHINGDVYHMWTGESHVGEALLAAGEQLVNLHMADSNRDALGDGQMDVDTILRALYLNGFNRPGHYCTLEPLGPGGDPYPAMYGKPPVSKLDRLVSRSVRTFRQREAAIKA